jgi:hypothetical protein
MVFKKIQKSFQHYIVDILLVRSFLTETKYIKPVFDEFFNLKSKLGNHDHWENAELIRKMLVRNGINICGKKSYYFKIGNDSIKIGGVRDFWEDVQVIDSTTSYLKKSDF